MGRSTRNLSAFALGVLLVALLAFSMNSHAEVITSESVALSYAQRHYPAGSYSQGERYVITGFLSGLKIYAEQDGRLGWLDLYDGDNEFVAASSVYFEKKTIGTTEYSYSISSVSAEPEQPADGSIELMSLETNSIIVTSCLGLAFCLGWIAGSFR